MTRVHSSDAIKGMWKTAVETYESGVAAKPRPFNLENFSSVSKQGYRSERPFEVIYEDEFEKEHGLKFRDVSGLIPVESVQDERGIARPAIMMARGPAVLYLFNEVSTSHDEYIHHSSSQLRPESGKEIAQWFRNDLNKVAPRGAVKGKALEQEDIRSAVAKVLEERAAARARENLQDQSSAEAKAVDEQHEKKDDDESSVDYAVEESPDLKKKAPSWKAPKNKKKDAKNSKGKGQSKGAGKGTATTASNKRLRSKCSVYGIKSEKVEQGAPSEAGQTAGPQTERSGRSSGSGSQTKQRKACSPAEAAYNTFKFHVSELDINDLLSGKVLGRELWQARRAVTSLTKDKQQHHAILLQGHVSLFEKAEMLLPANIHKCSTQKRHECIADLVEQGYTIPPFSRGGLLAMSLKDQEKLSQKLPLLDPPLKSEKKQFVPQKPTLAACELSEADLGKLLQRCVISEGLIPAICAGQDSHEDVIQSCNYIFSNWAPLCGTSTTSSELGTLLECAVREVVSISKALLAILSETSIPGITGDDVSTVMDARQGSKLIIKQAAQAKSCSALQKPPLQKDS